MSGEPTRHPRRDFLYRCATIPLTAITVESAAAAVAAEGQRAPAFPLKRSARPEAELAREVESLLKFVDPQVQYRHVPLVAEKNAWPLWRQAGDAYPYAAKGFATTVLSSVAIFVSRPESAAIGPKIAGFAAQGKNSLALAK